MCKLSRAKIAQIRADINAGAVYCGICNGFGVGRIYKTFRGNIGWEHYGSSAVYNTNSDLDWLLQVIFRDCETITPAEWSDYHINYVPIDKKYKAIDYSREHPNVCGV